MSEEEKIRQRQERLEAWKRKRAEEEEAKKNASPAAILSSLERQPAPVEIVPAAPRIVQQQPVSPKVVATIAASTTSASTSSAARPKADKDSIVAISPPLGTCIYPAFAIID